jgi:hypothetical protein
VDARRSSPNNRSALYYLIISRPDKIIARRAEKVSIAALGNMYEC